MRMSEKCCNNNSDNLLTSRRIDGGKKKNIFFLPQKNAFPKYTFVQTTSVEAHEYQFVYRNKAITVYDWIKNTSKYKFS